MKGKGLWKKLLKKKQKCQTAHKGNLNVVAAFWRRNNHQGDQILSTNSLQKYMEISQEKLYLYSVA